MTTVAIEQAQENLSSLIDDMVSGEHVVITRNQIPIAELIPVARPHIKPVFGSAKGMMAISEDFDAPLEDFQGREEAVGHWRSSHEQEYDTH